MPVQKQGSSAKETVDADKTSLIIAEYNALREEILKRIEIDHQLISLGLIAPGTILTIGFQIRNAPIMLMYPVLALFLSAIWVFNETSIIEMGSYIRDRIETRVGKDNIGWQSYKASKQVGTFRGISLIGARAIFIGTELLAFLAGISVATFDISERVLIFVGALSIVLTIFLLGRTPLMLIRAGGKRS